MKLKDLPEELQENVKTLQSYLRGEIKLNGNEPIKLANAVAIHATGAIGSHKAFDFLVELGIDRGNMYKREQELRYG